MCLSRKKPVDPRFDSKRFVYEEPRPEPGGDSTVLGEANDALQTGHEELAPTAWTLPALPILALLALAVLLASCRSPSAGTLECALPSLSLHPRSTPAASHDEISPAVRAFVDASILRALRDPVGLRDHALRAHGGKIMTAMTSTTPGKPHHPPDVVLEDEFRIGRCWALHNHSGQVGILLPHLIYPSSFSVDHIPREVAAVAGEAPRTILVWGVVDGMSNRLAKQELREDELSIPTALHRRWPPIRGPYEEYVLLASFAYDIYSPRFVQTFSVSPAITAAHMSFGIFVVEVVDNWGAPSTCLYRLRIHGEEAVRASAT
ncbi:hypothetical protein OH77DRAFT_1487202 [Trametes cingulata]|nr:hypothetical protein OH77DRAFT_1487202 [Trametes cingulata]